MTDVSVDEEDGVWFLMCLRDFEGCLSKLANETPTDRVMVSTCVQASN